MWATNGYIALEVNSNEYKELYSTIKTDLEVLELLKKYFRVNEAKGDKDIVVEIKGFARPDYEIRLKLWKYYHGKYYDFIELTYTKTLGFRESKDSKKEMKKIREERVKERAIKENAQKQAKIKRIEERLIKLQSKSKLSPIDLKSIKYNELKLKELKGE